MNNELFINIINNISFKAKIFRMGIGDWGLGIGDWGLGPIPNPQSPHNSKLKIIIRSKIFLIFISFI